MIASIIQKFYSIHTSSSFSTQNKLNQANLALINIGIGNYGDIKTTGESQLYKLLSLKLKGNNPIIFDVGANIGSERQYASEMRSNFPKSTIYAFEPNPIAYRDLCATTSHDTRQINEKLALGSKSGTIRHYSDNTNKNSELSGNNKKIFSEIFNIKNKIRGYKVNVVTIDEYCKNKSIKKIDFIKIDVEGSEYSVLKGAKLMLRDKRIRYIQFEFNIHNIYNKIFMKDFYKILPNYHFYRLTSDGLISLGQYSTDYEIFRYQNIFASREELYV